jgi:hypothetical protein
MLKELKVSVDHHPANRLANMRTLKINLGSAAGVHPELIPRGARDRRSGLSTTPGKPGFSIYHS